MSITERDIINLIKQAVREVLDEREAKQVYVDRLRDGYLAEVVFDPKTGVEKRTVYRNGKQ